MRLRPVLLSLILVPAVFAWAAPPGETDPTGLEAPAWHEDPKLQGVWARFTGRYIFERTCTSCHRWGPSHWTRDRWSTYLDGFPKNHEPPVSEEYADLTAMFRPARYVPTAAQRDESLKAFLLAEAPDSPASEEKRAAPYESLPRVGDPAPDFEITDLDGRRHRISEYRGSRQLVLVFSRAHW